MFQRKYVNSGRHVAPCWAPLSKKPIKGYIGERFAYISAKNSNNVGPAFTASRNNNTERQSATVSSFMVKLKVVIKLVIILM